MKVLAHALWALSAKLPYYEALQTLLALKDWTSTQKNGLKAIAKQTIVTTTVDNKALNNGILKDQQGGYTPSHKAEQVLEDFRKALWN